MLATDSAPTGRQTVTTADYLAIATVSEGSPAANYLYLGRIYLLETLRSRQLLKAHDDNRQNSEDMQFSEPDGFLPRAKAEPRASLSCDTE
jgi:hypothetical protein